MQQSARHSRLHTWGHQRARVGNLLLPGFRTKLSRQQLRAKLRLLPIGGAQQQGHPTHHRPTSLPPTEGWKTSIWSCSRVMLLAGVVTAAMLMGKKPAMASADPPDLLTVANSRSSSSAAPRGVWRSLKSATGAPFQALDRLMFPDEPIAFVRTSTDSDTIMDASAHRTAQAETTTLNPDAPANTATAAVEATNPMLTSSSAASFQSSASSAAPQIDLPRLAQLAAVASALGTKLAAAIAHCAAGLPTPGWPAESCALAGLSQVVSERGGGGAAVSAASSAALAKQLHVWGYAASCMVLAVFAWQVAASTSGDKTTKRAATVASTTSASAVPSPVSEVSGMLTDSDGSSCTAASLTHVKPSPAVFTSMLPASSPVQEASSPVQEASSPVQEALLGKQVVGPYCLMQEEGLHAMPTVQEDASSAFTLSDPAPASLLGKVVVGPYCFSSTATASAAAQGSETGEAQLPLELQGKEVGPYCLVKQQPAAVEAARAATATALGVKLATLHQAASETAVDDELSCVMTAEAAASNAGAVMEAAVAAAAAAAQQDEAASENQEAAEEHTASEDDQPIFRVDSTACAAPVGPTASRVGTLAAEAVREALVAESAAAAAAVAAKRAQAAAHLIELTAQSNNTSGDALVANTAAEAIMAEAAAAEVAAAVLADEQRRNVAGATDTMVAQLAAEAKAAEAAAAMAEMRRAVLGSQGTATVAHLIQDDASTGNTDSSIDHMQALIAEAVEAEAAAAALSGTAARLAGPAAQTPAAAAAEVQSLIAEAMAAEAAAMSAELANAELIAEAIAAEAAAAAGWAAAAAAGAAASAGGSAGDAAEALRPPQAHTRAQPTQPANTSTAGSSKELQQAAVVSWVFDMGASNEQQLSALTVLAAASGHPAIGTDRTGTNLQSAGTALDITDADAFKDEFSQGAADKQAPPSPACDGVGDPSAVSAPASGHSSVNGLAAALDAVSQQQMQQASATAVQLAQARLAKLYLARRVTRTSRKLAPFSSSAAKDSNLTSSEKGKPVAEGYSYLGVSDTALALALASLDAAGPVKADKSMDAVGAAVKSLQADTVQEVATADERVHVAADVGNSHSSISADGEAVLPLSAETAQPAPSEATKVEAAVESGCFTVPVIVTSTVGSSSNPYAMVAEAIGSKSSNSNTTTSSSSADSFEVEVLIEPDTQHNDERSDSADAAAATSSACKGFGKRVQRSPGRTVHGARIRPQEPLVNMTGGSSSSSSATTRCSSIHIEWISTPNSSKRIELKQRAAAVLAAEQQQELHPAAAGKKTGVISDAAAANNVAITSSGSLTSVSAQLTDVEPQVTDLQAAPVECRGQQTRDTADADMAAAYGMQKPLLDSNSSNSNRLPHGWGVASVSWDSSGGSAACPGSWSEMSAQLTAELETDLADLMTSAAARLDKDMQPAYSTPQVQLPASTSEPAITGSDDTGSTAGAPESTDSKGKTGASIV